MRSKTCSYSCSGRVRWKRRAAIRACIAALLAELALFAHADEVVPTLIAGFQIEAPSFSSNFDAAARADWEDTVSIELARMAESRFGCFQWVPQKHDTTQTNVAGRLTIKLMQVDRGYNIEASLGYFRGTGGPLVPFGSLRPRILYPATTINQPTQDPARLQGDVLAELRRQFDDQSVLNCLQREFVSLIPITKMLEMSTNAERVVIPIPWELLRASEQSILMVKFQTRPPAALPVMIKMRPRERNLAATWAANVGCLVFEFDRPPVATHEQWHPLMAESYAQRDGVPEVYMLEYWQDYSAGTTGPLADHP